MAGLPGTLNVWATGFQRFVGARLLGTPAPGASNPRTPNWPESGEMAIATPWSRFWPTWPRPMFRFAPSSSGSPSPSATSDRQRGTLAACQARLHQGKATSLDVGAGPRRTSPKRKRRYRRCDWVEAGSRSSVRITGGTGPRTARRSESGVDSVRRRRRGVGIPADLLQRRPDIRRALRDVASSVRPDWRRGGRLYPASQSPASSATPRTTFVCCSSRRASQLMSCRISSGRS